MWTSSILPVPNADFRIKSQLIRPPYGSMLDLAHRQLSWLVSFHCNIDINTIYFICSQSLVQVTCPEPPVLINGSQVSQTCKNQYGSVTKYKCLNGLILVGKNNIQCQASSEWELPKPECKADACRITIKAPPFSRFQEERCSDWDAVRVGDECRVRCDEGYKLEGESQTSCVSREEWSDDLTDTKCLGKFWLHTD